MWWMNTEPIIQREVSQKERSKYCVLMHIYVIQKDEIICRAAMETETQRTDLGTQWGGEEGEGGMYGESNIETYITISKLDHQWDFAV